MNNYIRYKLLILVIFGCFQLKSQNNLHYSQYYNAPMYLNPALSGQLGEDLFRLNAHSRQQWSDVSDGGGYLYQTMSGGIDFSLFHKRLGLGMYVLSDKAGGGIFNTIQIMPTASYSFIMGDNTLTFGGQYLYNSTQLDISNPKWPPGGPQPLETKSSYSDFNAGVNFKLDLYFINVNIGLAAANLLQGVQKFGTGIDGTKVPSQYKAYTNFDLDMTEKVKLLPGFYGVFQASSTNFVMGSNLSYKFAEGGPIGNRLILGLWFRTNNGNLESVIPKFGIRMNKMQIMGSYDYNVAISKAGASSYFNGLPNTFEISIIFTGKPKVVPPLFEDDFILNPRY